MPLNKAPSGALLFGGDMRLLIPFLLFFSLSSNAAVDVGRCSYITGLDNSGRWIEETDIPDLTRSECRSLIPEGKTIFSSDGLRKAVFFTARDQNHQFWGDVRISKKGSDGIFGSGTLTSLAYGSWIKTGTVERPCETPKTDDQCNKGKTATITGNDVFWATGNYKGCTFTAKDGVFVKAADWHGGDDD